MFQHFRPLFKGTLIANVKMGRDRGNRLIAEGLADLWRSAVPILQTLTWSRGFEKMSLSLKWTGNRRCLGAPWLCRLPNLPSIAR